MIVTTKPVEAVIFDKDGTIMDTEAPACAVWRAVFAEHGVPLTVEGYGRFIGRNYEFTLSWVRENLPGVHADELLAECSRRTNAFFRENRIALKPGLLSLLDLLKQKGIRTAVATSSRADNTKVTLERGGLSGRFDAVISGEMTERGKPAPDIFLLAAERLGAHPDGCLVVEDSDAGVRAALAAGMRVALIPDMAVNDPAVAASATYRFGSLQEVAGLIGSVQTPFRP